MPLVSPRGLRVESEIQAKQASIDMLTNDIDRMTAVNADLEKEIVRRCNLPIREFLLITTTARRLSDLDFQNRVLTAPSTFLWI